MTNREFFINSWEREAAITAKGFRALPDDLAKLNLSHHPKMRSPWQLVNHIGPHGIELLQSITEGRADLVNEGMFDLNAPHIYKSPEHAAKAIEENSARLINELKNVDDETWESKIIPVYWDGNKLFESSLMQFCWTLLNDTIHHRGQLSTYYRTMGVNQPNIYGPTTEQEEVMMASRN